MAFSTSTNMIPETGGHIPEDKDQCLVVTPYGQGLVVRNRRDGMREVELQDWQTTESMFRNERGPVRPIMLYSPTAFPSIQPEIGNDVLCLFGRGRVIDIRNSDHVVVVCISSWRLAGRSKVVCYLRCSDVQVVRPKAVYEMTVAEKIEYAEQLKQQAATLFQRKLYPEALRMYTKAVDAVRYVQHKADSTNTVRADLLVVMVTCSNNAATCCLHLDRRWEDAHQHAQHSRALLEALQKKVQTGVSKINQELIAAGHTDIQLFGEWMVKSLLLSARALLEKGEIFEAIDTIRLAREVISKYSSDDFVKKYPQSVSRLQSNDKELLKLLSLCKERRKIELKREKQRAQAMFASSSTSSSSSSSNNGILNNATTPSNEYETRNTALGNQTSNTNSPTTVVGPNGTENIKSLNKKKVSFADDVRNENDSLVWHKDPTFLGGLGVVIGVVGTIIVLSQLTGRRK